ncbi:MAG TPA: alanine racemase [Clostridiaceae bacterium]|nr:alanine racemase [Clostridiaceae bacterium]
MDRFPSRTWAEIDLDALAHNMREIRKFTAPSAEVMAVVKADAYGHGAIQVAKVFLENGASRLAVSMIDEAIELRNSGIDAPILTLNHTDPRRASEVIENRIDQTVYSVEFAKALSDNALAAGRKVNIHIKIDTGMRRVGFAEGCQSVEQIMQIADMPGISIEGIFTHYAVADTEDDAFTRSQYRVFTEIIQSLENRGIDIPIKHICNSAGTLRFPETHMDMVRVGIIAYGMIPPGCPPPYRPILLKPAMTLKSNVVHVKTIKPGDTVSYGRKYESRDTETIATIPIGYADGYTRRLSGKADVLLHGQRAPVIGTICMDMCMIRIDSVRESVKIGDEVVLFGRQLYKDDEFFLSVDEISELSDTINYEITCLIGKRVPRVYMQEGQIIHMHSLIW